jgi:hypothetical protein
MKKFKVCNSQTGWDLGGDPIEADSLEEAQAEVLFGQGIKVEEVEDA